MKRLELILLAIWVLSIAFKFSEIPGSAILLSVSTMSLAAAYAFAFRGYIEIFAGLDLVEENESTMAAFVGRLTSMALAVALVGILFKLQHWPGARIMLTVGALTLTGTLVMSFTKMQIDFFKGLLLRSLIFATIAWSMLALSPKVEMDGEKEGIPIDQIDDLP